jgi:hypothetical protein
VRLPTALRPLLLLCLVFDHLASSFVRVSSCAGPGASDSDDGYETSESPRRAIHSLHRATAVGSVLDAAAAAAVVASRIPVRDGQLLTKPAEFVDRVCAAIDGLGKAASGKPAVQGPAGSAAGPVPSVEQGDDGIVLLSARSVSKTLGLCRCA